MCSARPRSRPEQLDQELSWIDDHVGGKPYGVDIIVPAKFEGKGEKLVARVSWRAGSRRAIAASSPSCSRRTTSNPRRRRAPVRRSCPATPARTCSRWRSSHPIKLIANALGVPPDYMIEAGKERGVPVAALVGAKEHAVKQVQAGVDLIVAQGTEAGGHCGEVTTMVLIPEVIEAIDGSGAGAGGRRDRHRQADGRAPSRWARTAPGPDRCG